jgi:amino acid transporter
LLLLLHFGDCIGLHDDPGRGGTAAMGVPSEPQMKRQVSVFSAVSVVCGLIVGAGILSAPGEVVAHAGTPARVVLVWLFGCLSSTCAALSYAELGTAIPKSGGEFAYLQHFARHDRRLSVLPFLFSWSVALILRPCQVAIIANVCGEYLARSLPVEYTQGHFELYLRCLAAICILVMSWLNYYSVAGVTSLQNFITVVKVVVLGFIVLYGAYAQFIGLPPAVRMREAPFEPMGKPEDMDIGLALLFVSWSFGGWNVLNFLTEELVDPERTLPLAILLSLPSVGLLFLLINLACMSVLEPAELMETHSAAVDVAKRAFGFLGGTAVAVSAGVSTIGTLNVKVMSGSRAIFAASRDGMLPAALSRVHERNLTPYVALGVQCAMATGMVLMGSLSSLIGASAVVNLFFHVTTVTLVPVLRWLEPDLHRPFRVWLVAPLVYYVMAFNVGWASINMSPWESVLGVSLMLLGVPVWYRLVYSNPSYDWMKIPHV